MFKWFKRIILTAVFFGLVALNILTLTSTLVFTAAAGALSALGLSATSRSVLVNQVSALQSQLTRQQATNGRLNTRLTAQRNAARRMGARVTTRSTRIAATTLAELPAKAVPIIGITALIGGTIWEIKELCDGLDDVKLLYTDFDISDSVDSGAIQTVCNPQIPTLGELKGAAMEKKDQFLELL
mgnify:CR=1 FL=1|jgi:hypothetical protein